MANGSVLDKYDQFAVIKNNFLASGTGYVINQLQTGLTTQQKVAWLIHRLEYYFSPVALDGMTGGGSYTKCALLQATTTSTDFTASYLLDELDLSVLNTPAADNTRTWFETPTVHDLGASERLMIPQNVFFFVGWNHNGAPAVSDYVALRIWYREIELSPADWYDLAQLRMPLGGT